MSKRGERNTKVAAHEHDRLQDLHMAKSFTTEGYTAELFGSKVHFAILGGNLVIVDDYNIETNAFSLLQLGARPHGPHGGWNLLDVVRVLAAAEPIVAAAAFTSGGGGGVVWDAEVARDELRSRLEKITHAAERAIRACEMGRDAVAHELVEDTLFLDVPERVVSARVIRAQAMARRLAELLLDADECE